MSSGINKNTAATIAASVPAAVIGLWNVGSLVTASSQLPSESWQLAVLSAAGILDAPPGLFVSLLAGAVCFLPSLIVALVTSRLWAEAFARLRGRPLDRGWALWAWLFTLLLPPSLPLPFVVLGLSCGALFAGHLFGGTGRYIVPPALVGVMFVAIGYPDLLDATRWVPGSSAPLSWSVVAAQTPSDDIRWLPLLLGREVGAFGTGSALACALGAAWLLLRRIAAPGILAGGMLGVSLAAAIGGSLPGYGQLAVGNFAFALVFLATDPTIRPRNIAAQWLFGALFGLLTVLLRTADPTHPEGTLSALMLASLCVPLLDRIVTASRARSAEASVR